MEFLTTLKDTPIPTLLLIGGFIFLFLGIATIKKPIVIDVTPTSRKIALVLGIALIGAGLYLLSRHILIPDQPAETPTETLTAGVTETPANAAKTETETPSIFVAYSLPDIVHLGDGNFEGWAELTGECLTSKFPITLPVQEVTLSLETFGLGERAIIKANDSEISVIPPLEPKNQDKWSERRSFPLATSYFVNGFNILEICAVPVTINPISPGELDDFQIRNIQVTTK